jgi:hypothetical protein
MDAKTPETRLANVLRSNYSYTVEHYNLPGNTILADSVIDRSVAQRIINFQTAFDEPNCLSILVYSGHHLTDPSGHFRLA